MAFTPVHGKYARVKVGSTTLEFVGEWTLNFAPGTHDITTFETTMDADGMVIEQTGIGITKLTGTLKGRFSLGQVPDSTDIKVGSDAAVSISLFVKKPDLGYVVSAVWAGETTTAGITDFENIDLSFNVNSITSTKWA